MRLPLLAFHISAGVLAMIAGAAAISFRKGSRWHGTAGNVFVVSMLVMATFASCLAYMKHQTSNVFGGFLAIYMVATARRRAGETGILGWVCFCNYHWSAERDPWVSKDHGAGAVRWKSRRHGHFHGFGDSAGWPRGPAHAGARNFRNRRLARHLWRMCFGWFIATGSFFLGQQQVFPAWLRGSPVLLVPALLPLALLIFWMIRVRFTGAYKKMSTPRAEHAYLVRT
jgi:hypothetical protein